jgi:hypothetical protein
MKKLTVLFVYQAIACLIPFVSTSGSLITSLADPTLVEVQFIDFEDQTLGQYSSLTINNVSFTLSLSPTAQDFNQFPQAWWAYPAGGGLERVNHT